MIHTYPTEIFYSQFDEDRRLDSVFKRHKTGTCVEVGAYDGITGSNTLFFERLGWKCVLIEPNPRFIETIRKTRTAFFYPGAVGAEPRTANLFIPTTAATLATLSAASTEPGDLISVPVRTLDSVLEEFDVEQIDFITIDVEGFEMEVLKGFSLSRFNPRVVIIEDSSRRSDTTVYRWMKKEGYSHFLRTGCNDWYARSNDKELVKGAPVLLLNILRFRAVFLKKLKPVYSKLKPLVPVWMVNAIRFVLVRDDDLQRGSHGKSH